MPVTKIGLMLKPVGFFDRNPALDVPAPMHEHGKSCEHEKVTEPLKSAQTLTASKPRNSRSV